MHFHVPPSPAVLGRQSDLTDMSVCPLQHLLLLLSLMVAVECYQV